MEVNLIHHILMAVGDTDHAILFETIIRQEFPGLESFTWRTASN
jgi:hypothetical protein